MGNEGIRPEVVLANFVAMWLEEHGSAGSASAQCEELVPVIAEHLGPMLDRARAEGFRAARERAIVEVNLEREARDEEEIPAGVVIARIRAMKDGGEGGEPPLVCRRPECRHPWHKGPCPAECACSSPWPPFNPRDVSEPPLSQLRAATERMEATAKPGAREGRCDSEAAGIATPPGRVAGSDYACGLLTCRLCDSLRRRQR